MAATPPPFISAAPSGSITSPARPIASRSPASPPPRPSSPTRPAAARRNARPVSFCSNKKIAFPAKAGTHRQAVEKWVDGSRLSPGMRFFLRFAVAVDPHPIRAYRHQRCGVDHERPALDRVEAQEGEALPVAARPDLAGVATF